MVDIKEANSLDEIRALEKSWNSLVSAGKHGNFFSSFGWVESWFEHAKNSKPFVLSAWEKGKLVGIAALCIEKDVLCFVGQLYASGVDFAAEKGLEEEASKAFARHVFENLDWKMVRFLHLADSPIFLKAFEEQAKEKGFVVKKQQGEASNVVSLPATVEEYFASLKKTRRRWLRKKLNRLERKFSVETRMVEGKEFEEAWQRFVELHERHMAFREMKSVLNESWFQGFYKELAERALKEGKLFLMELVLDKKVAGSLFGVTFGKTLNAFNVGLNQEDSEYFSLGKLLLLKAIWPCCEKDITTYDLLPGGSEYKKVLGTCQKGGLELQVFRNGRDALAYSLKRKAKDAGKRILS